MSWWESNQTTYSLLLITLTQNTFIFHLLLYLPYPTTLLPIFPRFSLFPTTFSLFLCASSNKTNRESLENKSKKKKKSLSAAHDSVVFVVVLCLVFVPQIPKLLFFCHCRLVLLPLSSKLLPVSMSFSSCRWWSFRRSWINGRFNTEWRLGFRV